MRIILIMKTPQESSEVISPTEDMRAQICACGTVHFSIGPLTLRFSAASFERLFRMVAEVRSRLEARGLLPQSTPVEPKAPVACA